MKISDISYTPNMPSPTQNPSQVKPESETDARSMAVEDGKAIDAGEPISAYDLILDLGMNAYVEELREERREELREKILAAMGLSEEALDKMPPEARAEIEKMINQEIADRMAAEDQLARDRKSAKPGDNAPIGNQLTSHPHAVSMGDGMLQVLQEADMSTEEIKAKKDEDGG